VFRISRAAARNIAAEAGLDWDQLCSKALRENFSLELDLPGLMELQLSEPQVVEIPNVIGFIGGYDIDHADEIVVIYSTFEGLGLSSFYQERIPEADLEKIAVLLEILHTWNEKSLDPRRSALFVLWGGEDLQRPFFDLVYGLFEKNKLSAKVPTNMNPYLNTNPVKPAIWIEIGNLSSQTGNLVFSEQSSPFLGKLVKKAGAAANLTVEPEAALIPGVNSGLPNLYIWEENRSLIKGESIRQNFAQKGILINRTLVQLLRDMKN
jgi:hypothetical protein